MIESIDIEWSIMNGRTSGALMLPRYTPTGWWEMDVAELTESGYLREYEIKVSRADFTRDARKSGYVRTGDKWFEQKKTTKHELMAAGHSRSPNNFFFVVPDGLIPIEDCPAFAGLIYVFRRGPTHWPEKRIVKRAPRIHGEKREGLSAAMLSCCGGRLAHFYAQTYFRRCAQRRAQAKASTINGQQPKGGERP